MSVAQEEQLGTILDLLAQELDVPEELRKEAVNKYDALGEWIRNANDDRLATAAEVYPQGSIRLGTMIQPVNDGDDYDVDLVYRRDVSKTSVTQQDVMDTVGEQLRRYRESVVTGAEPAPRIVKGRRCWTLKYPKFHMDVLPAIPDENPAANNIKHLSDAILITDKKLRNWGHSNPRGFSNWFDERQRSVLLEERRAVAKAASVDVAEIPSHVVRTPLRQGIKLLKRHRDVRYDGKPDDKPISIIITTLAAKSYGNERNTGDTLRGLVRNMARHIEQRDGVYWVENPINPKENFADKWSEYPKRAREFFDWVEQVDADISTAMEQRGLDKVAERLSPVFGEAVTTRAASRYGDFLYEQRKSGSLRMGSVGIGSVGHTAVTDHTFFGT